jgi:hypothetical protein
MRMQTSIEFLVILAALLLAFGVFLMLSQSESIGVTQKKMKTEAENAVNELSSAAKDVYSQGAGARKRVMITIPFGYEANESFIGKKSIKLHVNRNDYVETTEFELYGSLPSSAGRHAIWIISEGEKVKIGSSMIAADINSINLVMGSNDTRTWRFNLINTWNDTISVSVFPSWSHTDIGLVLSENSFVLAKGSSAPLILTFSSNEQSRGFYPGMLNISADDGTESESIKVDLSVEILSKKPRREGPALMVIPSRWNETLSRNSIAIAEFQVCTNTETSLSNVDFNPSIGEPGKWIGNNESIGPIATDTCLIKSLSLNIPNDAEPGNYSGFIYLTGDAPGAADAIALGVIVGGSAYDVDGPQITDISVFPENRNIYAGEPVIIVADADDTLNGNNSIEACEIMIDSGPWFQMIASDGAYDEPTENATYAYFGGFSIGEHTANIQCKDEKNNWGIEQSQSFNIKKEFLFITQDPGPTTTEQEWMDWIDIGFTGEGYVWNIDSTDSASFISGTADLSDYSVVVLERWVSGLETRVSSFADSGGSVVLLGNALTDGPAALGLTVQTNNPIANDTFVDVVGAHYITGPYSANVTIFTAPTAQGRFWKDLDGQLLARSPTGSPPHFHVLGLSGSIYFWGPTTPDNFSFAGIDLTSRMLDHSINASGVG